MTDRYTKAVLTIIAGALTAIAIQMAVKPEPLVACGDSWNPCYIKTAGEMPVSIKSAEPVECGSYSNPCYIQSRGSLSVMVMN